MIGVLIIPLVEYACIKGAGGESERGRVGELTLEIVVARIGCTGSYVCIGLIDHGVIIYVNAELFIACAAIGGVLPVAVSADREDHIVLGCVGSRDAEGAVACAAVGGYGPVAVNNL